MGRDSTGTEVDRLRRRVAALERVLGSPGSDTYLGSLFDTMFEGIQVLDFDWRYVYLNAAAARHGRRSAEDLVGRSIVEEYPGIEATELFGVMRRCMTAREPQRMLNAFTFPDGSAAWFDLRMTPVPIGILVLSVDVSDRKAAEDALRRGREDLRSMLRCMADGVVTTDVEGRVTTMNPAAETLLGWTEDEAGGRPLGDLARFESQATGRKTEDPVARVLREGTRVGLANDTVLRSRGNRRVPIASSGAVLRDPDGAIRGTVLVLRDVSEEHRLGTMLQRAQRMDAVGRLAGGIAHDFNNLLTVITGYCEVALAEASRSGDVRSAVEEIRHAADSATALTRQLLAFSRKQVLQPAVVDLNEVVGRMEGMLRRLIGEDVDFATDLATGLDRVYVDPAQIEQIVLNLAVNARDAMPRGGKLTIETANVELGGEYVRSHPSARPGPHVMLAVTDTGIGMDEGTRSKIFEPFFTTKGRGKGTGLGLATVYGIVRQSGGNIWVYSEPGRGTTFKIYLPLAERPDAVRTAPRPDPAPSLVAMTVLVVEDDDAVRRLIRTTLETGGYTVLDAGTAERAIETATAHEGRLDGLLTDVVLPGMGGRELADRIAAIRPGISVVYMSGYTDNAIVHHGVLDSDTAFIQKPFAPATLLAKLREFLSKHAAEGR